MRGVVAAATLGFACVGLAQRVTQPIYRPRPGRPPARPGRLDSGGVNYGNVGGFFTIVSVSGRDNKLRLRDDDGNIAEAYVSERTFDVETLNAGDVVIVDFFVQDGNEDRLEVASIEKLEPASR